MSPAHAADEPPANVIAYPRNGPTALRIALGAQLRRLREERGLSTEEAGYAIRGSHSKISRMENGRVGFKERDVADLLTLYGVTDGELRESLLAMARQSNTPGWWHQYGDVLPDWFLVYIGLEQAATLIRTYEVQFVPGLLQTEDYARAMIRSARPDFTPDQVEQRVRVRLARQSLLTQDDPIDLWVVLDEAVISRPVGGDAVMRAQLERLVEAADLPNVTLQVLPFEVGAHAGMDGTFAILGFPEPGDPDVVYAENATGGLFLEKRDELQTYIFIFDHLRAAALRPEESVALIAKMAEEPLWKWRRRGTAST